MHNTSASESPSHSHPHNSYVDFGRHVVMNIAECRRWNHRNALHLTTKQARGVYLYTFVPWLVNGSLIVLTVICYEECIVCITSTSLTALITGPSRAWWDSCQALLAGSVEGERENVDPDVCRRHGSHHNPDMATSSPSRREHLTHTSPRKREGKNLWDMK